MIKSIKGHKYIDFDKKERFLFECYLSDLEQLDGNQVVNTLGRIKNELNQIDDGEIVKVYNLDGIAYLDVSQAEKKPAFFNSDPYLKGISNFFSGSNIYSDPLFKDDYCKANGHYFRFITIEFKDDHQVDMGDFSRFGDYFICFQKIKTIFAKFLVNDARKMGHTALYSALSDIEGIETYKENEEMLRKIITREEELFKTDVSFIIRATTELELQKNTDVLINELEISGLSPRIETTSLNNIFKNYIPGHTPKLQKSLLFHTSLLANSLPTHRDFLMESGVGFNARSGKEIFLNTRDGSSFSLVVTGVTGLGKTFLVQKILDHELKMGRKCFIIDPKHDYRKFALLNNANIIDSSINPMIFKDPVYLKNIILSKIPKKERSSLWEGKLLRAIRKTEAYNCNNFFQAIEKIKTQGFDDLEFYFEDIIDKISESKMDLRDFSYIEFESFSAESIPFLLSFSFEYVKRLNAPYNLVIDEAHRIFKHDPTFLEERVREMRVQNSSLFTITQKYSDLVSNYFGEVVADNSYHKIFFSQKISLGDVTEFDAEKITSLKTVKNEYSEFYYKSEQNRKTVRYYPTLKEIEVFKSGNKESDKMLKFIKDRLQYFSVDECVNQWVRDKYA